MRSKLLTTCALVVTLAFIATGASAHSGALEFESPTADETCYIYTADFGFREYWAETNGLTEEGVDFGVGDVNHVLDEAGLGDTWSEAAGETGLQRSAVDTTGDGVEDTSADTQLDRDAWLDRCAAG